MKAENYYVNPHFAETTRIFPPQDRYGFHRYDMNENPEGLPREFVDSVLKEITPEFLATYPEPGKFTAKYAAFIGVEADCIMTTNGSDTAIRYLLETFGRPGSKIVTVSPSFEMYRINCSLLGLKHCPVEYGPDLQLNAANILSAIDADTSVVVALNPNNPIAGAYTEEEMRQIAAKASQVGAVLIIDEAYHYFYKHTFLPLLREFNNILILRTFSKCFSLAACRLGVVISNKELIGYALRPRLSFDVNAIALLFAERLMDHPEILRSLIRIQEEGKAYLLCELRRHGYECHDCLGNYVFIAPRREPSHVETELKEKHRVLVKTFGHPLLRRFMRVSTGSVCAMQLFLDAFLSVDEA